ncbi:hypothetical protein LCGC14_2407890, partial [marine sediment metagenome]
DVVEHDRAGSDPTTKESNIYGLKMWPTGHPEVADIKPTEGYEALPI